MMDSKTKYNLDHVYCHTNESSNYIRANPQAQSNDVMSLLKENKQLKAMLILHMDLIQEQSDQLLAKDKLLVGLKEENLSLKAKNDSLEKQLQNRSFVETIKTEIKEEVLPEKSKYKIQSNVTVDGQDEEDEESGNIIGECNGKLISKIILHRISLPGKSPSNGSGEVSEGEDAATIAASVIGMVEDSQHSVDEEIRKIQSPTELMSTGAKVRPIDMSSPLSVMSAPSLKIPEIKIDSDESVSCDSTMERDQESSRGAKHPRRSRRCGQLTTTQLYSTREWEDEDFCDEFIKEEANALKSEAPMLEIPKWTVHEVHPLYSIEGTEDLSDETFLKRHAKLEYDEKRRKKWDVQQIREQRRIERLKRRHCKDELREEDSATTSFFPAPDSIQTICFTTELPVMAFGEGIPRLSAAEFALPWYPLYGHASVSHRDHPYQQQSQNSSFVFLKKRRRPQSSSVMQSHRGTIVSGGVHHHRQTTTQPALPPTSSDGGRN
ncbi:male-specific lethal 1 homolog [Episyrphus balteatus]|uniref:male-specific lethal 1 homolog n=1 Tax=Episyrphus balteatus TaxID=286459 RepID=UPI0024852895|nr:male-specific lethal 1 homolog [Episyrphus balteatus]